jgi:hypothetical protein
MTYLDPTEHATESRAEPASRGEQGASRHARRSVVAGLTAALILAAAPRPSSLPGGALAGTTRYVASRSKPHYQGRKRRKRNKRKARGNVSANAATRLTFSNQVARTIRAEIWTLQGGLWSLAMAPLNGGQENRTLEVQAPCEAIACWIDRTAFVGLQGLPGNPVATMGVGGAVVNGQWNGGTTIVNRVSPEELQETGMDVGEEYLRLLRASTDPTSLRFLLTYLE